MTMRYIDPDHMQPPMALGPMRVAADPWATTAMPVEVTEMPSSNWGFYWRSVKRRLWLVILLAVIGAAGAGYYVQTIEPIYRSTATLLIESGKTKILSIEEVYNAVSQDREYFQTQVEILRSYDVARRTVINLKLWDEPEFDPRKAVRSWRGRIKDLINPPPPELPWTPERLVDAAVASYLGAVTIEPVRLSQLVKISFEAADKDLAAKVADATARSYIESDRDNRLKLNLSVTGLLQDRLIALREKLRESGEELQRFRERSDIVGTNGPQGIAGQRLAELSQRLIAAQVRKTELESAYQLVSKIGDGNYAALPAVLNQPQLTEARTRLTDATRALERWTSMLGENHRTTAEARAALETARAELTAKTDNVLSAMQNELAAARETVRTLGNEMAAARRSAQGVNRQDLQLAVLEREVQTNRELYELFLNRTKETSVSSNLQAAVARLVDPARPATAPLRPQKGQMILTTVLSCALLGALLCIYLEKRRDAIQGSDEVENRFGHHVIATLPAIRPKDLGNASRSFIDDPTSRHSEGIRAARTSILLSGMAVAHKLMLVTSALPDEGKTTFCSNLALANARTKRTLLIDCDFRDPQIGNRIGLDPQAKGIADLVSGSADVQECIHSVSGSALMVMPAGTPPENPEEFLLSAEFRDVLKSLANRVDIVLIDSPPVNEFSDALILSQQANDTIYVIKSRRTPRLEAQRGLGLLRQAGASILGIVLTNSDSIPSKTPWRRGGSRSAHA